MTDQQIENWRTDCGGLNATPVSPTTKPNKKMKTKKLKVPAIAAALCYRLPFMQFKIGLQPNGSITATSLNGKRTVIISADARFFDIVINGYFETGKAVKQKNKSDKKKLFKLFNGS